MVKCVGNYYRWNLLPPSCGLSIKRTTQFIRRLRINGGMIVRLWPMAGSGNRTKRHFSWWLSRFVNLSSRHPKKSVFWSSSGLSMTLPITDISWERAIAFLEIVDKLSHFFRIIEITFDSFCLQVIICTIYINILSTTSYLIIQVSIIFDIEFTEIAISLFFTCFNLILLQYSRYPAIPAYSNCKFYQANPAYNSC